MRAGFSFAEVMFAVVVLGIGFIMLASIFPVAIRQTASVVEENDGTALTKKAAGQFREALLTSGALPQLPVTSSPVFAGGAGGLFVGYAPGRVFAMPDPRLMYDAGPGDTPPGMTGPLDDHEPLATQNRIWAEVKSRLISADDGRYAFVPLYRRDRLADGTPSPWIQLTIIAMQNRSGRNFDPALDLPPPHAPTADPPQDFPLPTFNPDDELPVFYPRPVEVMLTEGISEPDKVTIRNIGVNDAPDPAGTDDLLPVPNAWRAAAEGAYLVISDSRIEPTPANIAAGLMGRSNGRIYRLGNQIPTSDTDQVTFELVPGEDMAYDDGPNNTPGDADDIHEQLPLRPVGVTAPATGWPYAFIIGRPLREATSPYAADTNPYEGLAQEITAFTTFVQVK